MGEQVGSCVGLQSQLQLGHYSLLQGYFKSDVGNGDGVGEPALHLRQPVTVSVILNVIPDFVDSFDNVDNGAEGALTSYHITDFEFDFLFLL